jgi:hypothetical protein
VFPIAAYDSKVPAREFGDKSADLERRTASCGVTSCASGRSLGERATTREWNYLKGVLDFAGVEDAVDV